MRTNQISESLRKLDRSSDDHNLGIRAYRLADMIDWIVSAQNGSPDLNRNPLTRVGDSFGNDNTWISINQAEAPFGYPAIEGEAWTVIVSHRNEKTFYSATSCESMQMALKTALDLALSGALESAREMLGDRFQENHNLGRIFV